MANKLIEVVWPKDRPVARQVVKVVHDDRKKQVQNLNSPHCSEVLTSRVEQTMTLERNIPGKFIFLFRPLFNRPYFSVVITN